MEIIDNMENTTNNTIVDVSQRDLYDCPECAVRRLLVFGRKYVLTTILTHISYLSDMAESECLTCIEKHYVLCEIEYFTKWLYIVKVMRNVLSFNNRMNIMDEELIIEMDDLDLNNLTQWISNRADLVLDRVFRNIK